VNWVHVEAMVNVIALNLRDLPDLWRHNRPPTGFEAVRAYSAPGTARLAPPEVAVADAKREKEGEGEEGEGTALGKGKGKGKGKGSWEFDSGVERLGRDERDRPRDWAGVAGRWKRFVCFMDYRDLYGTCLSPPMPSMQTLMTTL
jgi:hypothetical protein